MLTFHNLQKEDLRFFVGLFNEQYIYDKITKEILNEKIFLEENFDSDLNFIVKHHNRLAGFASGIIREIGQEKVGWIKLLATIDQKKMGSILETSFHRIKSRLIQKGATKIHFWDTFPNYFTPGIYPRYTSLITLLEKKNCKRRRDNVNMSTDLMLQDFNTANNEKLLYKKYNIAIKRALGHYHKKVLDMIIKNFPNWQGEIGIAFTKKLIPLHIAAKDNKVIAFATHSCNNIGKAWFGPMGKTEKTRSKGIGEILLKRCLQDLKEAGYSKAIIPCAGLIGFYFTKCNAEVSQTFWNYLKGLSNQ